MYEMYNFREKIKIIIIVIKIFFPLHQTFLNNRIDWILSLASHCLKILDKRLESIVCCLQCVLCRGWYGYLSLYG